MKSKTNLTLTETLAQLYVSNLNLIRNNTIATIKLCDNQCKMLRNKIIILENNEPMKILKKLHKSWEEKLEKINRDYEIACNNLINEYMDLEEVMDLYSI